MNILTLIFNAGKFVKLAKDVESLVKDIAHGQPIKDNIEDILGDLVIFINGNVFSLSEEEKNKYLAAIADIKEYALAKRAEQLGQAQVA